MFGSTTIKTQLGPFILLLVFVPFLAMSWPSETHGKGGQLLLRIIDKKTSLPIAARLHLETAAGKPKKVPGFPFLQDHSALNGDVLLELPLGDYRFRVECGLEYLEQEGGFHIDRDAMDTNTLEMERFVDMAADHWWSGDLCVKRPLKDLPLLMQADDLHFVSWFDPDEKTVSVFPQSLEQLPANSWIQTPNQAFEFVGGGLQFHRLERPLLRTSQKVAHDCSGEMLMRAAAQPGSHLCAADPASWDFPLWVASQRLHSVMVMGFERAGKGEKEDTLAERRPRDHVLFPQPHGEGRWREHIYYQLLNCGLRSPPVAGSASGLSPHPVGFHRVYAHVTSTVTAETWWEAVEAGRVMITNGPLMNPKVNGQFPGHVFKAPRDTSLRLQAELTLHTREKIAYLEIVKNGRIAHSISLQEWKDRSGQLPAVDFDRSGWMTIRAVTDNPESYRLAMSGPFYVEIDEQPLVSKGAVEFFREWENVRLTENKSAASVSPAVSARYHKAALAYWDKLLESANAP